MIACFNGHNHLDDHKVINGIHYIQVNSMSYQWLGEEYACPDRYDIEINEKYPSLQYTAPYSESLYAIVDIIAGESINISGTQASWISPSPFELGYPENGSKEVISPKISDRNLQIIK